MNDICEELHRLKHFPQENLASSSFPQRLMAESLPMRSEAVARYVTQHILEDQHTLVKLLKGEKGLHELLDIAAIDSFRDETRFAIQECSNQIADAVLARLLIDTVLQAAPHCDLRSLLGV